MLPRTAILICFLLAIFHLTLIRGGEDGEGSSDASSSSSDTPAQSTDSGGAADSSSASSDAPTQNTDSGGSPSSNTPSQSTDSGGTSNGDSVNSTSQGSHPTNIERPNTDTIKGPPRSHGDGPPAAPAGPRATAPESKIDDAIQKAIGEAHTEKANPVLDEMKETLSEKGPVETADLTKQVDQLIENSSDPSKLLEALESKYDGTNEGHEALRGIIDAKQMETADLMELKGKDGLNDYQDAELNARIQRFADQHETSRQHAEQFLDAYYKMRGRLDKVLDHANKHERNNYSMETTKKLMDLRKPLANLLIRNAYTRTPMHNKEFAKGLEDREGHFYTKKNGSLNGDLAQASSVRDKGYRQMFTGKEADRMKAAMQYAVTERNEAATKFWNKIDKVEEALKAFNKNDSTTTRKNLLHASSQFESNRHTMHSWVQSLRARANRDPQAQKLATRMEAVYGVINGKGIAGGTIIKAPNPESKKNEIKDFNITDGKSLNSFFNAFQGDNRRLLANIPYASTFSHLRKPDDSLPKPFQKPTPQPETPLPPTPQRRYISTDSFVSTDWFNRTHTQSAQPIETDPSYDRQQVTSQEFFELNENSTPIEFQQIVEEIIYENGKYKHKRKKRTDFTY